MSTSTGRCSVDSDGVTVYERGGIIWLRLLAATIVVSVTIMNHDKHGQALVLHVPCATN